MAVEVTMPRLSDSMEEGTILEWLVAEGDTVERDQPLVEVETDKANMTYDADTGGVLLKILVEAGASAPVGGPIAFIGEPGESVPDLGADGGLAESAAREPLPAAPILPAGDGPAVPVPSGNGATAAVASPTGRVPASPLARRIARELGVDLAGVAGTGPKGRIVRADVEAAARGSVAALPAPPAPVPAAAPAPEPVAASQDRARGEVTVEQLSRLQSVVARRMAESRATVPDFELRVDVDMGAAVELRDQLKRLAGETGTVPSYNDMIVKACAIALREFPRVNGAYRDGGFELFSRVNVGVAVAADDALVVPTVRDADSRSLGDIARTVRELAGKVRDGSITPPELSGGTFTVSNLGMFGVDSFSAVINVPQAAILAVGAMKKRPVVDEHDEVVVRPTLTMTLACDHRILYGADGAKFIARVRDLLEQPLSFAL